MKKVLKGFMVVMMLSLFFGMGSQAAVRRVSVGKVTQLRIKASHKVKRKPCYHIYIGKGCVNRVTLKTTVKTTGRSSKAVTYRSSNRKIATVSSKGRVYFKKAGQVRIYITSKANPKKQTSVRFLVRKITRRVKKITPSVDTLQLQVGESKKVKFTISPRNASMKNMIVKSRNTKVATIKDNTITAVAPGKATIVAKAVDGSGKYTKIVVTVRAASEEPDVDTGKITADTKFPVNATVSVSDKVGFQSVMNGLVGELFTNNYIPTYAQDFTVNGITYKMSKDGLTATDASGKAVDPMNLLNGTFTDVQINNIDSKKTEQVILGLNKATKNLKTTYKFPGATTIKSTDGTTNLVLSEITVSSAGMTFKADGKTASAQITDSGRIKITNCPELVDFLKAASNGIIA